MEIKTTYNINDALYVYTKEGLVPKKVHKIVVHITDKETKEYYMFEEYGDIYSLNDIVATSIKDAVKAIKKNEKSIQFLLEM